MKRVDCEELLVEIDRYLDGLLGKSGLCDLVDCCPRRELRSLVCALVERMDESRRMSGRLSVARKMVRNVTAISAANGVSVKGVS